MVATAACSDTQAPSVPTNLTATARTATSIALTWTASTDSVGVVGYGLYRGGVRVGDTSGTTGAFTGLVCGTNYTLAVDAVDAMGNRSTQAVVMVSTTACGDTSPPSTPSGLAASGATSTSVVLSWNASTDNVGVAGYDVIRNGTRVAAVTGRTATVSGLACGTSYSFSVAAFDVAGNRSAQAQITAAAAACTAQNGAVAVSSTGNDATCVRGDITKPCASFDRAYALSQLGDTVQVSGGSYPFQRITAKAGKDTSGRAANVVFEPAPGATVRVAGLEIGADYQSVGADHLTVRNMSDSRSPQGEWAIWNGSNDVTLESIDAANWYIAGSTADITVRGGDWGPCLANDGSGCGNSRSARPSREP